MIGKVNNDTLKIIEATIDRKLALAKLQTQIVSNDNKSENTSQKTEEDLSDTDKALLRELFDEKKSKTDTDYDIK